MLDKLRPLMSRASLLSVAKVLVPLLLLIAVVEYLLRPSANDRPAVDVRRTTLESTVLGTWHYNNGDCFFRLDGPDLVAVNERGQRATAVFRQIIEAPGWAVTGELSKDGKQLRWSNGTVWTR